MRSSWVRVGPKSSDLIGKKKKKGKKAQTQRRKVSAGEHRLEIRCHSQETPAASTGWERQGSILH